MKKSHLNLLNNVQEDGEELPQEERYMLIDGLNLFFRNFSAINAVNPSGAHIGGLGGFFRSLGALIRQIQPTEIIISFDGQGSSTNRKNLIPEYKASRNIGRVTNWEIFDNLEEEDDSKIDQMQRIITYLQTLPVKVISMPKVEADDVIAHLAQKLTEKDDKSRAFIVSSDKDYLQLVNQQVIVYRPIEREFYTTDTVKDKFGVSPHNFILYKLLMGDASDGIAGIKGLGEKKLKKLFPELSKSDMNLDDLLAIAEERLEEHVIYARLLHDLDGLGDKYTVMDLSNPMIGEDEKLIVESTIKEHPLEFHPEEFIELYEKDQLGGLIRNVDVWLKTNFGELVK